MNRIRASAVVSALLFAAFSARAQQPAPPAHKPLREAQVVALVAGDALPEDVAHAISAYGLAFHPGDTLRAQLKTAGATPGVIAALHAARVTPSNAPEHDGNPESIAHLVKAAALIKSESYEEATNELTEAMKASFYKSDAGFVMGRLLVEQQQFTEAAQLFAAILGEDPSYPEAHSKLSYVDYRLGDSVQALSEAQSALEAYPEDAEAYKDRGSAYEEAGNTQAALDAYASALRIKPDYSTAQYDIGILYMNLGDYQHSIPAYRKAIAMDPSFKGAYVNLAITLDRSGDSAGAVQVSRKAKELFPTSTDVRETLGSVLMHEGSYHEAAQEFGELEALAPESSMCHVCYAQALFDDWKIDAAETEYKKAVQLDPTDGDAYSGLGNVEEQRNHLEDAVRDYEKAAELDSDNLNARIGAGRTLMALKRYSEASTYLKQAAEIRPTNAQAHQLYADSLQALGQTSSAIAEYKLASSLDKNNPVPLSSLATIYENQKDYPDALAYFRQAVSVWRSVQSSAMVQSGGFTGLNANPQEIYDAAFARYKSYLAALRAAGKSAEADSLEKQVAQQTAAPNLSAQLDELMAQATAALRASNSQEGEKLLTEAAQIADKIQPPDNRVVLVHWYLGGLRASRNDFSGAQTEFARSLEVATTLYGKDSPNLIGPLNSLGQTYQLQQDFPAAERIYNRAVEIAEKSFGDETGQISHELVLLATIYTQQKQYDKAEPLLNHAVRIDESVYGKDSVSGISSAGSLCQLYSLEEKWAEAVPCYQHVSDIIEKQYGSSSPQFVFVLNQQAAALRGLGKTKDADDMEARAKSLLQAAPSWGPVAGNTPGQAAPGPNPN